VELYFSTKGAARRWGERALSVMSVERDVDSPNTPKRVIEQAKVRTPPEPSERERERERGGELRCYNWWHPKAAGCRGPG
jgi:hypothetical protein